MAIDAARDDQRHILPAQAKRRKHRLQFLEHPREVEAPVPHVRQVRYAKMATGVRRMLDHDRVGQAPLLHPLLEHERNAAGVGQNRDQGDIVVSRHIGQVERQTGTHHDRIRAAFAGDPHIVRLGIDRLHHVDGNHAPPFAQGAGCVDLARQRREIGSLERRTVGVGAAHLHQIGVMVTQIDAGDRAKRALAGYAAGEPVGGNADAHAALDDWQQRAAADHQRGKGMR